MAFVKTHALLTRLREVLEDGEGVLRVVPSNRLKGDLPEGLDDEEQKRRAFYRPRVRSSVSLGARSKYSPPINGNLIIYEISVTVVTLRTIERREHLKETLLDDLTADANEDMDVIRQALEYPGNLTATEAGAQTDLVSGMLAFDTVRFETTGDINQGAQKLEAILSFHGFLQSRPQVSEGACDGPRGLCRIEVGRGREVESGSRDPFAARIQRDIDPARCLTSEQ